MSMNVPIPSNIRWFPRLCIGRPAPAAACIEDMVSVSWLLMTEMFAYLEDVSGAPDDDDVQLSLAIRLAELVVVLDQRLRAEASMDELHHLPLLLEHGLTEVAHLDAQDAAETFGLAASATPSRAAALTARYEGLLAAFPGQLFNTLLPESQSQTLRTLRAWNRLCVTAGTDAGFLAPLMRSL